MSTRTEPLSMAIATVELDQLHLHQAENAQAGQLCDRTQTNTVAWASLSESILVKVGAYLCDDSLALAAARLTCKAWRATFSLLVNEVVIDIRDRSVEAGEAYVRSFCAGELPDWVCRRAAPINPHCANILLFTVDM